ncbi:MAG: DNA-directed RNA polymerase subunit omega [Planctomycetaceae bacterium]|nr:DNA-directed RNA polymerase subunit omega [Planctomycetaceae bacterium]
MLDEFKEENIVNKIGGRFKLSSLIQKRLVALNRGARPLVEIPSNNPMEVVVAEIMQDKIYLDTAGNVAVATDGGGKLSEVGSDAGPSLDDL